VTFELDVAEPVDEFDLPARNDSERGGAPDYAVLWADRLWIIELKTEKGSHRADQIPSYFELAHHHYPTAEVDLLYLTPPMEADYEPDGAWARYAHTTWADLVERDPSRLADHPSDQAMPHRPGWREGSSGMRGPGDRAQEALEARQPPSGEHPSRHRCT
jgi:hypothetical protein